MRLLFLDILIYKFFKIIGFRKIKILFKKIGLNSFLKLLTSRNIINDIDQNLNITNLDNFENEMLKHFNSSSRTKKIFDDFKSELKRK